MSRWTYKEYVEDVACAKDAQNQDLLKTLRKLTVSAKATLDCIIHIHNYVETYDSYDLDTAFDFIKSQLDQSKLHIRAIEKVIDDESSER